MVRCVLIFFIYYQQHIWILDFWYYILKRF